MNRIFKKYLTAVVIVFALVLPLSDLSAQSDALSGTDSLITKKILGKIRAFVDTDIVRFSIENQNKKYGALKQSEIDAYDQTWRSEVKSANQPLISATLSNPLSSYLTRVQAHSLGLYTEMFAMDQNGLNVGQSSVSSDFWQGDEAKFKNSFNKGKGAVFIDDVEFNDSLGVWVAQVSMTISDAKNEKAIGAITIELNLTELQRRKDASN